MASGKLRPGWALDLGCGSGVSSRYLAEHGFRVIGVDLALSPLLRASRAAREARLSAYFCVGDVSDLGFLQVQATFALDIGCFHALLPERRSAYIVSLAERLLPGAFYLLYAFEVTPAADAEPSGIGPRDIGCLAPYFTLRWAQHGFDRERPAAWYLLQRAPAVM